MSTWDKETRVVVLVNAGILACLAAAVALYVAFGHRVLGAMYRGESIASLNAMIRGQSVHPVTHYFAAADKLLQVGALLILASALVASTLYLARATVGPLVARYGIPVLTPALCLFALAVSMIVFFYPLEIETRESTLWLHTLALRAGVNIYNHSRVAFINAGHGPFDAIFKLAVTTAFPFLEPWQVARSAVVVLPYVFLVVAWRLLRDSATASWLHALYLGSIGYLLLLVSGREFFVAGRSDATVAVFLLLLAYASIAFAPASDRAARAHGAACGALGTIVVLANWRTGPVVVALFAFTIFLSVRRERAWRRAVNFTGFYVVTGLGVFSILLVTLFHGDPVLYYKHFFGFFSKDSGWGHKADPGGIIHFALSLFNPADPEYHGGPLLLVLAVLALTRRKGSRLDTSWLVLGGVVFLACAAAYYVNWDGGGPWYFIPFLIVMWVYVGLQYPLMTTTRRLLLGACVVAMVAANRRSIVSTTLHRAMTRREAAGFMARVRTLQATNTVVSEDQFFFERSYHGELIDMGDTISAVYQSGYYGSDFNATVKRYFDRMTNHPPDYVLTGYTPSPELKRLLKEKYVLVAEAPDNFRADFYCDCRSQLFERLDLVAGRTQP